MEARDSMNLLSKLDKEEHELLIASNSKFFILSRFCSSMDIL